MIFEKPSLRTRVSFDVGIQQLGGFSVYLSPAEINLGKRESVYDVARNLERMVQGIMIRTFAHDIVETMAEWASVPVINGLTDYSHPCQAMADFLTILEHKGRLEGLKLAYVGDSNNVSNSLMFAAARFGMHVAIGVARRVPAEARGGARGRATRARRPGRRCSITADPAEAVAGADVVYTDTWASMGQEAEADARKAVFRPYQVNAALFAQGEARRHLHALPAGTPRRGGHRRGHRLAELGGVRRGREPAARAEGHHAGDDEVGGAWPGQRSDRRRRQLAHPRG